MIVQTLVVVAPEFDRQVLKFLVMPGMFWFLFCTEVVEVYEVAFNSCY